MALISSTFDLNAEGWTVFGDAQGASATPTYVSGYVRATDDVAGGTWYWKAPARFLGDQSAAYGVALSFDLRQSATDSQAVLDDVIIEGGGLRLSYRTGYAPGTDWTHYSVSFDEGLGWRNAAAGRAATADELRTALGSLSTLLIRGEYRIGADTGSMDNVLLQSNLSSGTGGDDVLAGDQFVSDSTDTLNGLDGNDTLSGLGGGDQLFGGAGNDSIAGAGGADRLYGGFQNDALAGGDAADRLFGEGGNDTVLGERGNDTLSGGLGKDILVGGSGSDSFVFNRIAESAVGSLRDEIRDFSSLDIIDLSGIDADSTLDGNQAFGTVSAGSGFDNHFAQAGQLYFNQANGVLYGNTDADAQSDFQIRIVLSGLGTLTAADFLL